MTRAKAGRRRQRGTIDRLPSGALRVRVYGGQDPVSGKRNTLVEVIEPGPRQEARAEAARTRLLNAVDEQRSPRTSATLDQLLDRYLETLDVGVTTHRAYTRYLELHVRPFLGRTKAGAVGAEALDSLYAELRRCRDHCSGSAKRIDHRTPREHECDDRCRPHRCRPLAPATIRHIHFVLNGAYSRGVRWRWVSVNPVEFVSPPAKPPPDPQPPSAGEAARLLNEAWRDLDWGALVWLFMTTGARRGELCALRWSKVDLESGTLTIRRAIAQDGRALQEKDTKTHQQRRLALDSETVEVLRDHRERCEERARALGVELRPEAFVFSLAPDGSASLVPGSVTQRYSRMAARLGLDTHLHNLRHYSATELIAAGVDVRTVAGRLGHSGGGVTTLRVYAAWVSEADQRAASGLGSRMPERPAGPGPGSEMERVRRDPRSARERLAVELLERIESGAVPVGGHLPGVKVLAAEQGLAPSTVHRAFELLREWGVLAGAVGERPTVVVPSAVVDRPAETAPPEPEPLEPAAGQAASYFTVVVRGSGGRRYPARVVTGSLADPSTFRAHLLGIARMEDPEVADEGEGWIGRYEIEVVPLASPNQDPMVFRW
ncbi:tyrosine-type recombinase/integrase [Pseudonocardia alni]|uniref:Site-specific recombinase XerD n=1 Tax=Pseudonocardia alni TaxID=33907 RepID=A0AA44ZP31_PSEA5|nr:tyrosine-type recombinase/integrase [Pseudonocardia alni]PKB30220.1 site-specific recombinase XerD [Pseudonocardia alni]